MSSSAVSSPSLGSMRMSSGPSRRKLMPRAGLVELRRAHAEVGADARRRSGCRAPRARSCDATEGRLHERDAIAEAREARASGIERDLVAIERDDARLGVRLEDRLGVAAAADRRVDVDAGARGERLGHLRLHHRRMDEVGHVGLLSRLFRPYPLRGGVRHETGQRELRLSFGARLAFGAEEPSPWLIGRAPRGER